jgi:ubiquitin carboxyl-terminal hydrolase 8
LSPNQAFGGSARQHDASEFLGYILGILHDETNRNRNKPSYETLLLEYILRSHPNRGSLTRQQQLDYDHDEEISQLPMAKAMTQEWERQLEADNSIISRTFHGQWSDIVRCTKDGCGFAKHRFSTFARLQLQFPPDHQSLRNKLPIPITDMLDLAYNKNLDDVPVQQGLKCWKCKGTECKLDQAVTYMPEYLVVDIQRFGASGGTVKIQSLVEFEEFIDFSSIVLEAKNAAAGELQRPGHIGPFTYQCYAAIIHIGSGVQSGHYIALARNLDNPGHRSNMWHEFNDRESKVRGFPRFRQPGTTVTSIFLKRVRNSSS